MSQTDDIITSTEQLASFAQDLTDIEVKEVGKLIGKIQIKYGKMHNTPDNLDKLRDEVVTRLAEELNILATVDPTPCFHGEPPIVEILGKVSGDSFHQYGFDHERKYWEVQQANKKGEAYLGQKEKSNG
jgi:hypothetical protein